MDSKELSLTHLDKVFWPDEGYTKGDLIAYYQEVAPVILPYLLDRPQNLNRHPNGIAGESFFQKDLSEEHPSWIKTKKIHSESTGEDVSYLICEDESDLLYMVNLGCIELNPWSSRVASLDKPDYAVIDLDPENIGFDRVVEVALVVRDVLERLGVPSYPKTSGATGIHVYIPLEAHYPYEQVREFTETVAKKVHIMLPEITSLERHPSKRQGKVYLDYLQNGLGQTTASPYSVRPRPGATVSAPLKWEEVTPKLSPHKFTIKSLSKRLDKVGDIWKPVLGEGVDLKKVLERV
jgi:bifunctional non-homologous end joining protein LigD